MPSTIRYAVPVAVVLALAASGARSSAWAQASGTLQASVTVIDDPVSRSVSKSIRSSEVAEFSEAPTAIQASARAQAMAVLIPAADAREPRVRVEVLIR